jgi:hypothetical protein
MFYWIMVNLLNYSKKGVNEKGILIKNEKKEYLEYQEINIQLIY